jgi:hypothetical protein
MLPKYKLDEKAKQKIAIALKDLNCWSDDDDYEAVNKLRKIEEDSSDSESDCEQSLESLASTKYVPKAPKLQSSLLSTKSRSLQPMQSRRNSVFTRTSVISEKRNTDVTSSAGSNKIDQLVKPKYTVIQTKHQSAKLAYLEQQKEVQRMKAKEIIVKKAVKLIMKLRTEEMTAKQRHSQHHNLSTLERLSIESIATTRVNRIIKQGIGIAIDRLCFSKFCLLSFVS